MIASNIKRLSRMELLYTCLSDLAVYLHKQNDDGRLKGLEHYYAPDDYNKMIYWQRKEDYGQRLQTILSDADSLLQKCNGAYSGEANIRMKHLFGFKIGALNFRKLLKYLDSRERVLQYVCKGRHA